MIKMTERFYLSGDKKGGFTIFEKGFKKEKVDGKWQEIQDEKGNKIEKMSSLDIHPFDYIHANKRVKELIALEFASDDKIYDQEYVDNELYKTEQEINLNLNYPEKED